MSARSKARKAALDVLFEADLRNTDPLQTLQRRIENAESPVRDYTKTLVEGVCEHQREVDARIVAAPDAARGIPAYDLDYRIYAGKGPTPPARGRLDLRGFKLFELAGSKAGDSIRIGARLASVTLDPARGDWLVALEPDSGSFITHDRALAALGLGPADHEPGEVRP